MSEMYLEASNTLDSHTLECSRAIKTVIEELEAVMYYQQRVSVTQDESLKQIMAHNRDEEIEHAAMTLEWLRRNMEGFDHEFRTYLFTEGNLTEVEENTLSQNAQTDLSISGNLGIGSLK